MRNNQPVTGHEVFLADDMIAVSGTDEKGRIKFANKDFLTIAGFAKEELIGESENILRHPDMPAEIFEDLWRDLKKGLSWSGFIKNRSKKGDHYWVLATVMPQVENGILTGYVSILNRPVAEAAKAMEAIYRKFRDGRAGKLAIEHGRVVVHGLKDRLKRSFERLSGKLMAVAASLCLMILVVGGAGYYVSNLITDSLRTVYSDRMVPVGYLRSIDNFRGDSIYDLSILSTGRIKNPAEVIARIERAVPEMDRIWAEYMATNLTPEERPLSQRYADEQMRYLNEVLKPALQMARAEKYGELSKLVVESNKALDEISETSDKLIQMQLNAAKEEYVKSQAERNFGLMLSIGAVIIAIMAAVLASAYLRLTLDQRLRYLDGRLNSIMSGNYRTDIAVGDDELQTTLTTVQALQAKLAYSELEKKELEREKHEAQRQLAERFEHEVGDVVNGIGSSATELTATAESMGLVASETSHKAMAVAASSEQATANVQTVSAATEELAASVREIQVQVVQSTDKISEAVQQANATNEKVLSLSEAAQKIGSVIDIIREIAGQTNLLALNATIEAARAGEAGKGFAVVASEVKNLAGQTARATEEISQQVAHIQEETRLSVEAIKTISAKIDEVNKIATTIASAVEEQGSATQEIARNITEAAAGTQDVTGNMVSVREATQNTGAAAEQVLATAQQLAKNGENLKVKVANFLHSVRAS